VKKYNPHPNPKPQPLLQAYRDIQLQKRCADTVGETVPVTSGGYEKLEQLRALEHGFTIKVKETIHDTLGVDTPEDLERIEKCLNSSL